MWHKTLPSRSSVVVKRSLDCIIGIIVEMTLKVVGLTALYIYAHGVIRILFQRVSKPQDWVALPKSKFCVYSPFYTLMTTTGRPC